MSLPMRMTETAVERVRRWSDETGFTVHHAEQWGRGVTPGDFLRRMDRMEETAPKFRRSYMDVAYFTTTRQGWPAQVQILPAYAPGFVWFAVLVGVPFMGSKDRKSRPRSWEPVWYPTPMSIEDVPALLKLWRLEGLKWGKDAFNPVFDLPWELTRACVGPRHITYFDATVNEDYMTIGRGNIIPLGAKRKVELYKISKMDLGDQQYKFRRMGACASTLESVERVLQGMGLVMVKPDEARIKNNTGVLYYLPKMSRENPSKVLKRICAMCAKHFRKWIIEGNRNFMSPYQLNEGETRDSIATADSSSSSRDDEADYEVGATKLDRRAKGLPKRRGTLAPNPSPGSAG